jgi:hypothetical protein
MDQHMQDEDTAPVLVESADIKKEMERLQWPELEGDTAPSALVPKACQSLQKQVAKLEAMVNACKSADRLSPLQQRKPVIK